MSQERAMWSNKIEFVLSTIGYSVGVGNIWRFPYLCMENGGGAFLIPYFFFLFICGAPMFLAEVSIGQFTGLSPTGIWNFAPIFTGLGWSMVCISGLLSLYYNVVVAWVLYYLGMSFNWVLPWSKCGNYWNTEYCYSYNDIVKSNLTFVQFIDLKNITLDSFNSSIRWRSSAEEFYLYNTLNITKSINELGGFNNHILICFIVAWILTYVCLINSVKSVGKVVYFTALAPYVLLTVIIIQGSILPGSWLGIKFYLVPQWKTLLSMKVWTTAATQIFYSLGPAWGGLISMASFNKFNENIVRTSTMIPIICCMSSFYGSFAIFSIIGHMAYITNITDITQVIESGPGLAFVAYPQAMALLPGGAIWSVLFFLTLLTLGMDSMFATYETLIQGIADECQKIKGKIRHIYTASVTLLMILVGLPLTTRAGAYIFQIVDWYSTPIAVIIIALFESFALAFFYNYKKLITHIEIMQSQVSKPVRYWLTSCMCCLTPISLLIVFINIIINFEQPVFDKNKHYPKWSINFGWSLAILMIVPMPVMAIYILIMYKGNWRKVFRANSTFKKMELLRSNTTISATLDIEKNSLV
uniref:Transporter n=1 Tax=Schmidtea mediterranea TaxID=79327 RepID=A0A0H3YF52_SCHMD|nr:slc6a-12 [Schmidtea mediterranea]